MSRGQRSSWTFLSNHAHVLLCIRRDPEVRIRHMAAQVGITERAVQAIVTDLIDAGYVTRCRVGRRNQYDVLEGQRLRHPLESDHVVGELLDLFAP